MEVTGPSGKATDNFPLTAAKGLLISKLICGLSIVGPVGGKNRVVDGIV
jgi:hypothetical protein